MTPAILVVAMLAGSLIGGCGAGAAPTASPIGPSPANSAPPSEPAAEAPSTPAPTTAPSPVAVTDDALMERLAALWSTPYDATQVAALYAPDAVFHDNVAGDTTTGLDGIGAKVERYADMGFRVVNTSAPIRQDDVIAVFQRFGAGDDTSPGLGVVEIKDGMVQTMWEYPAGSSPATASPAPTDDEALMADVNAVWGGTPDPVQVAALYAPDATFHDTLEGKAYTGVEAIAAKAARNAAAGFTCAQTSPAIRQGDVVAVFHRFSAGGAMYPVLAVFELKDGKVINQWAYPAP
jgi:hypothetical protein